MIFIIFVLIFLMVGLVGRNLYLKGEIHNMADTIVRVQGSNSNEQITINSKDKDIALLANTINQLFDDMNDERILYERYRKDFGKNMENISHDLRTPLTSIIGYINLLENNETLTQKDNHYISVAKNKADVLKQLVDSLFDLTQLEALEYPYNMESVDLNERLSEELAGCYDLLAKQSVPPVIDLCYTKPLKIMADKSVISRIFSNLLQNIFQHGGTEVQIYSNCIRNKARVTISNRTVGLAQEDIPHLFDRFYTGDITRAGQHSGLGLSIVKEFVNQMKGNITIEYENGVLTFILEWEIEK